jgi:hypothetical protein
MLMGTLAVSGCAAAAFTSTGSPGQGSCSFGITGTDATVLITGAANALNECDLLIGDLGQSGITGSYSARPRAAGEVIACRMRWQGTWTATVRDSGSQDTGRELCARLATNGWAELSAPHASCSAFSSRRGLTLAISGVSAARCAAALHALAASLPAFGFTWPAPPVTGLPVCGVQFPDGATVQVYGRFALAQKFCHAAIAVLR